MSSACLLPIFFLLIQSKVYRHTESLFFYPSPLHLASKEIPHFSIRFRVDLSADGPVPDGSVIATDVALN